MNTNPSAPYPLRFSTSQQVLFARRLSLYLHSGIPIARALSFIREDAPTKSVTHILKALESSVAEGFPLSHGLGLFPKQFTSFSVGFVQAGEASGMLSETLARLAVALSKRDTLRRKVVSALIYPGVILFGTIAITLFLVLFIFPKIIPVLKGFRAALPFTTRVLIGINQIVSHDWPVIICLLLTITAALMFGFRFKRVRRIQESLFLLIPLFSELYQYYLIAMFSRSLSLQLKGGIRILTALRLMQSTMPGILYSEALEDIGNHVAQGHRLSTALSNHSKLFPALVCQMVAAGEATGTLGNNLETLANTYEENLDELVRNLTVLIEPALMIVMGFIVGFVALAIITPIYGITQNLTVK